MRFTKSSAAALVALPFAAAQTSTTCNPTEKTCPQDTGLNAATFESDFTSGDSANSSWSAAAYTTIEYGSQGAEFTIAKAGEAPTIQTDFYVFFGRIDVKMKAAPGTGIVSSIVFESDDLDEIDWEFLGGNTTVVETNFFGKGNTTAYDRAIYYPVTDPQADFHTYSVDWTSERIEWIIDGTIVRTLGYNDPLTIGGTNYPQTPMRIKLGNWCGGCAGEPQGTVTWAGGKTTWDGAPYNMYVESVSIQNYNPADSYEYTDETGSWESIKIIKDGKSSNPSGSAVASSIVATATSAGSSADSSANTSAPTSSVTVSRLMNTQAAVSTTITGNSATATETGGSGGSGGTAKTSAVGATTEVPGSSPTSGSGSSAGSGSGSAASASGSAAPSTGGAASLTVASGSIIGAIFGFLLL